MLDLRQQKDMHQKQGQIFQWRSLPYGSFMQRQFYALIIKNEIF